ncbi:MAG TPA: hypothetical protein VM889_12110 [Candidatus Thermoplasmatota archaeon]|nr:hypothetical protein [Candidatus Thermoplasmatota archaeon]
MRYADVQRALDALPPGAPLAVPRAEFGPPHPRWRRSIGLPRTGARWLTQWRDGVVHVHVTPTHYVFHRDRHDPMRAPLAHLRDDVATVVFGALAARRRRNRFSLARLAHALRRRSG